MSDPVVHFQRFDGVIACRFIGQRQDLAKSPWEVRVTCKLCRRTVAFKQVFPLARHKDREKENAMTKVPQRLTFAEKGLIHELMKAHLHRAHGNDDKGRPYFKYDAEWTDRRIAEHLKCVKIPHLNIEHVSNHRLTEFGVLVPSTLKPPVPGSLAALQQQFDSYKKYVDNELEVHRKAILFLARQNGKEPQVKDILDE